MFRMIARSSAFLSGNKADVTLVRRKSEKKIEAGKIKKSVFISQSRDVFTNLALEDWFYKHMDFTHHHVMLLWRNDPCVVVGRNQNPWEEANVAQLHGQGVKLARRNSGGGTVFHDAGNLNLTFFTSREMYNRRNNLELITRALFREWGLKADISKREDIVIRNNYKISGTAAKLGRVSSYHHCTILVDVDKNALRNALSKTEMGIVSKATKSVPSPVMNLREENHHITVEKLMSAVGWEWLRTKADELTDAGLGHASQQNGFKYINPTNAWFPELTQLRSDISCWEWVYGKTPKFTANFHLPLVSGGQQRNLNLSVKVDQGKIDDVAVDIPRGLSTMGFHGTARVSTDLTGRRFTPAAVAALQKLLPITAATESKASPVKAQSII